MNEGVTNSVIAAAANSGDPIFTGIAFILVVITLLAFLMKPLVGLINDYKQTNVISAKADAESRLYEQLRLQIEANSKDISDLKEERDSFKERAEHLEKEVAPLVSRLQITLEEKERIIKERDIEIRKLTHEILDLRERLSNLEMRLDKDEVMLGTAGGLPE